MIDWKIIDEDTPVGESLLFWFPDHCIAQQGYLEADEDDERARPSVWYFNQSAEGETGSRPTHWTKVNAPVDEPVRPPIPA